MLQKNPDAYSFKGKVALVTGAGRGIGRAHALLLARLGASVVVNDIGIGVVPGSEHSSTPANAVFSEIVAAGGTAVADFSDVGTPAGGSDAVQRALDTFGRIDCVVNNAGTSVHKAFESVTPDELHAMLQVHVSGHFFVTQAAWPHMVRQKFGRVMMTTSGSGLFGSSQNHHYAAAKGAIVGLTRSLAIDASANGITVNAIAPLAATRLADNIADPKVRQAFKDHIRPEQVAHLVAWLLHERCVINGEVFEVGGGLAARVFTAEGRGYFNPDHDIELIETNMEAIMSEDGYMLPRFAEETASKLLRRVEVGL